MTALGAVNSATDLDTILTRSDGWVTDASTWTYASASTFTIAGDKTAIFMAGTRLKWTQTTVKYGVVISSSYSNPNTTVTIAVNSNYVVTNAAISATYYSYQEPPDYPGYFDFATTWVGFTATVPTVIYRYSIFGHTCIISITTITQGTSNATSFTVTMPVLSKNTAGYYQYGTAPWAYDNGAVIGSAICWTTPGANTVTINKSATSQGWTNVNNKSADVKIFVEF